MSYSYTTAIGDGVTKDFSFSFAGQDTGYLRPSDVKTFIGGLAVSSTVNPSTPNVVSFSVAPPVGAEILIRRVMPRNVPYSDFSRGNPFSQDALNNTNLQMLYLIQEIYDGYLPAGFYFRVDIDMRGKKLINLGDGSADGDAVNMKQLNVEVARNDNQDRRLISLEDNIVAGQQATFFAQLYVATGGETTINTTSGLFCAAMYIQGLFQHKISGAYSQVGGKITLAEPLKAGWEVYLILGTELPPDSIYATIESVTALQAVVNAINNNYATKGANSNITSLSGLTTPLSISQGGSGNTTGRAATATKLDVPRGLQVSLSNPNAVNFDGSSDVNNIGVNGTLALSNGGLGASYATLADVLAAMGGVPVNGVTVAPSAGRVGEVLEVTSPSDVVITPSTFTTLASLVLTPGVWEVSGNIIITGSATSITAYNIGIAQVQGAGAGFPRAVAYGGAAISQVGQALPVQRIVATANTTVYAIAWAAFTTGTAGCRAFIHAHRVR